MIERHVTFSVLPGKESEFEKLFINEYCPAMSTMTGFERTGLLHDLDNPSQYCMVICFDTVEDAAAWRASAPHQALKPKLSSLYQESSLQIYEVIA